MDWLIEQSLDVSIITSPNYFWRISSTFSLNQSLWELHGALPTQVSLKPRLQLVQIPWQALSNQMWPNHNGGIISHFSFSHTVQTHTTLHFFFSAIKCKSFSYAPLLKALLQQLEYTRHHFQSWPFRQLPSISQKSAIPQDCSAPSGCSTC